MYKVRLLKGLVLGERWRGGTPKDGLHREAPTETGVQFLFQAGGILKGMDIQNILNRLTEKRCGVANEGCKRGTFAIEGIRKG